MKKIQLLFALLALISFQSACPLNRPTLDASEPGTQDAHHADAGLLDSHVTDVFDVVADAGLEAGFDAALADSSRADSSPVDASFADVHAPDARSEDAGTVDPDLPAAYIIGAGFAYSGRASDGEDHWIDVRIVDVNALGADWLIGAATFGYVTTQMHGLELPWTLHNGDILRLHGPDYIGTDDVNMADNNPDRWDFVARTTFPVNMKHGLLWVEDNGAHMLDAMSYVTARNDVDWLTESALDKMQAAVTAGLWPSVSEQDALSVDLPDDNRVRLINLARDGQAASDWMLLGGSEAEYYVDAEGLTGLYLKAALHRIIKGHTVLPYSELPGALRLTDADPANPENLIQFYTGVSTENDFNREHVWAKSHGGFDADSQDGYSDLHQIRPTRADVNSKRWHLDFDEGGELYSDTDCRVVENLSFEPRDAVKGDVARILFYMAVRYEGDDSNMPDLELVEVIPSLLNAAGEPDNYSSSNTPHMGRLSTLLRWHIEDPVDDFERNRNVVIYNIQHNRNPFIDHPEWVSVIWGQ